VEKGFDAKQVGAPAAQAGQQVSEWEFADSLTC
jgi:hypothetical protein